MRILIAAGSAALLLGSAAFAQGLTAPDNDASLLARPALEEILTPVSAQQGGAEGAAEAAVEEEAASPYQVIEADASIAFANRTIVGYSVGLDRSLILRANAQRYYRATLDDFCARDLRWETSIGVSVPAVGTLRRSDYVVIDGRRCIIHALDQIADPRPVERAAREAERNAQHEDHD